VADPGLHGDAHTHHFCGDLIDYEGFALDFVAHGVEGLFGGAVLDDFDAPEESHAADVADGGVFGLEGFEFGLDVGGEVGGALDEVEALHFLNGGNGGAEGHGMGLVGMAVGEVVFLEVVGDLLGSGAEAEGDVGGGDALGGDEDVGSDAPVIDGEPLAGSSPAGHDFVGDEEDAVPVADFADAGEVFGGRDEDAVGADDGFEDDGGDVGLVADHVLDVVGTGDVAGGVGVLDGAVVTVGFRGEDDAGALAAWLHGPASGVAGGGDGAAG